MQQLNAAPRDNLTVAQVTSILQSDALSVDYGVERLDGNDAVIEDISTDVVGGQVDRSNFANIHGTCKLSISRPLQWGAVRARPYMLLTGAGLTARFNLGVYILTTPDRPVGETPATYAAVGYDKLYLLSQQIGDGHSEPAGSVVLDRVRSMITASGAGGSVLLDSAANGKTLTADKVWTLDANKPPTYLGVINDLLATIGYRGMWVDQDGAFRSEPYITPANRAIEYTFSADDPYLSLVGVSRTESQDLFPVPNWWRFIRRGLTVAPVEGAGQYTVQTADADPTSATSLGYFKRSVVFFDAVDEASLQTQGDQQVATDRQVTQTLKLTTAPFPLAGHFDIYQYVDAALGTLKVQESTWSLPLNGADMTREWQVVS